MRAWREDSWHKAAMDKWAMSRSQPMTIGANMFYRVEINPSDRSRDSVCPFVSSAL
jgi:hypothetical protein